MILHKALVILSVIFDTIICNDDILDFKDTEEYKAYKAYINTEEYKAYINTEEYKNCLTFVSEVGLKSDSGLYNFMFFLQFKDKTGLMEHVESTYNDLISTKDHYQTIKSNLDSFYINFTDGSNNNQIWRYIAMTPNEFCTLLITEKKTSIKSKIFEMIKTIKSKIFEMIKTIKSKIFEKQPMLISIEQCERTILNYKLTKGDKQFAYNENCGYKCFLTSIDIGLKLNFEKDEKILNDMEGATCGYFKYHLDAFHKFNDEALFYTAPNICLQMNLINIKKTSNLQKDVVNKNEEENH